MKERMKIEDHVDVLCLGSFDGFIKDLKEARKAIMAKYPEAKKSEFRCSVGPFNHCVHVDFQRWATEEEIKSIKERREKKLKEIEEFVNQCTKEMEAEEGMVD